MSKEVCAYCGQSYFNHNPYNCPKEDQTKFGKRASSEGDLLLRPMTNKQLERQFMNTLDVGKQYVVFGYNPVSDRKKGAVRLSAHFNLNEAKNAARIALISGKKMHVGVAKVQHPQSIWFFRNGNFVQVDPELVLDIIMLLAV